MNYTDLFACHNLEGTNINGWSITQKLPRADKSKGETGGNFSICYLVEKDGKKAFMKVLDYLLINSRSLPIGITRSAFIQQSTSLFNYEKDLSEYCRNKKISKVIYYIDSGESQLEGYMFSDVSYIIYEMANGDIRKVMDFSQKVEFSAKVKSIGLKLKSLHDVAVGLSQLHRNDISHQDLKPSNVLAFDEESKIGDLGRSLCFNDEVKCPYPLGYNGDLSYASIEQYFNYYIPDKKEALYQIDNYMLGSLICFYIVGVSFNTILNRHLPKDLQLQPLVQYGDFELHLPDLINAFQKALKEIENNIPLEDIKDRIVQLISYLCYPDPKRTGHPKTLESKWTPNYDLHRTVQELDYIHKRAELAIIKQ